MTTLDRIMQMQAQGIQDTEIIRKLRDENIPPSEINDALNQAKIKQAVSQPEASQYEGMEPSITEQAQQPEQQYQEQYPQDQQYQQGQYYPEQQQYYQPQLDTETITEIAGQVVSEKFAEFNKKTGDLSIFKETMQEKVKDLDERIKKIETSLDQIQKAIIGKVGEYGESMTFVHKDLENIHDTMSKLMNPLIDNYREMKNQKK